MKRTCLSDEIIEIIGRCLNRVASLKSVFLDIGLYIIDKWFGGNNILIGL